MLAVTGPFNWYYTLFSGMLGLGFLLWQLVEGRRQAAAWMLCAMAVAALSNAPLIPLVRQETPTRPSISAALFSDAAAWTRVDAITNGGAPLSELSLARTEEVDAIQVYRNATAIGSLVEARFTVNPLRSTPGALAFGVGLFGLVAGRRRSLGWAAIALGATVLTLGPFLALDERPPMDRWAGAFPLPYYWAYEHLPFFSKAYRPYRIGVITLTCLGALGAVGTAAVATELRRRWVILGVALLSVVGFSQPLWSGDQPARRPLSDARIPDLYGALGELPPGAVVEVPLQYQPTTIANARYQYNQTRHKHPVLNCNQLIRRTDLLAFRDYVLENAFLSAMVDLARSRPPYRFTGADLARMREDGFAYVVVRHRVEADLLSLAGEARGDLVVEPAMSLFPAVLGEPVFTDLDGSIYRLPDRVEATRSWVIDGEEVVDVDFPFDALRYLLPLHLPPRGGLPLWDEGGRQLSFWARALSEEPVYVEQGEARTLLRIDPAHWTWQRIPLTDGPVGLVAGEGGARLEITQVQVLR